MVIKKVVLSIFHLFERLRILIKKNVLFHIDIDKILGDDETIILSHNRWAGEFFLKILFNNLFEISSNPSEIADQVFDIKQYLILIVEDN
jgi:hypothetical protein